MTDAVAAKEENCDWASAAARVRPPHRWLTAVLGRPCPGPCAGHPATEHAMNMELAQFNRRTRSPSGRKNVFFGPECPTQPRREAAGRSAQEGEAAGCPAPQPESPLDRCPCADDGPGRDQQAGAYRVLDVGKPAHLPPRARARQPAAQHAPDRRDQPGPEEGGPRGGSGRRRCEETTRADARSRDPATRARCICTRSAGATCSPAMPSRPAAPTRPRSGGTATCGPSWATRSSPTRRSCTGR